MKIIKIYDNYNGITIEKSDYTHYVYNNGASVNISNNLLYFKEGEKLDFDYYLENLVKYSDGLLNEVASDGDFISELKYYLEK